MSGAHAAQLTPFTDPVAFEHMCAGKERFPSESAAQAALDCYREMGFLRKPSLLSVYECPFGEVTGDVRHYHFGH